MGDVPEASSAKVRVPTLKISLPELPVGYTRDQHLILNFPIKVELRSKAVDSSERRSLLKRPRQDGDDEDEQPIDAKATRYALRDGEEPAEDIMSSQEVPATQVADFPLVPQGAHDDSLITPAVPKASSPPLVTQWDPKAAPPSWESMGPKQQIGYLRDQFDNITRRSSAKRLGASSSASSHRGAPTHESGGIVGHGGAAAASDPSSAPTLTVPESLQGPQRSFARELKEFSRELKELAHELKGFSRDDAAEYVDVVDVADSLPS